MKHEPRKKKQMVSRLPLGHRALALLLALLMVFTATGMQVFANDGTDTGDGETAEEPTIEVVDTTTTPEAETTPTTDTVNEETPAETTPSEEPAPATDTTTPVDTTTDETNTGETTEPTGTVDTTEPSDTTGTTEGETAGETTTPPEPLDLTSYINKSSMNVTSGETPYAINGETVPSMEYVSVTLEFGEVTGLAQGQKLVYNIPQSYVQADTISESNTDKNKVLYRTSASTSEPVYEVIGTFTLDASGKVTITPDEKYLTDSGTVELPGGQFTFTGMLSSQLGEGEQSLQFGNATALKFTISDQVTEDEPVVTSPKRGPARAAAATATMNIAKYITDESTMSVYIDGKEYSLADLATTKKEVPEGSDVSVKLYFTTIKNIPNGTVLTYQIPTAIDLSAFSDPVDVIDSVTGGILGSFVISSDGLITITIDDSYHTKYANPDGTLDLHAFNLHFDGSFSKTAGQHEGSNDNIISFTGGTTADDVYFEIPFDYVNDRANVQIEKNGEFDVATRTIHYTVKVTAPASNTAEAYNVKVTDEIFRAKDFIEPDDDENNEGNLYRNAHTDNGTFDPETGVWTIDGNMKAGTTHTLTYDLVVTKEYYTDNATGETVGNTATVTFNDSGENQATVYQPAVGTVLVNKDPGDSLGEDTKGTYITYTLTATAYRKAMSGIVVSDAFTTPDYVSFLEAESASQGSVKIGDDNKSLTWAVGDLEADQSATLTYRAYLDLTAWESGTGTYGNQAVATKYVNNTAKVSVNNPINPDGTVGTGGSPIEMDSASTSTKVTKMWVEKDGSLNKTTGVMSFTIKVNSAPTTDRITSIWDQISGGTYRDGYITMTVYESSTTMKQVDSVKIPVSEVKNDAGTRWEINLAKVPLEDGTTKDLSGKYYYVLTYDVDGSSNEVQNQAGLGIGDGGIAGVKKKIQGLSGWTKNTDYTKTQGTANYTTGLVPFTITLSKTVTTGFVVKDYMSSEQCYGKGATWYDDDTLSKIVVKQGDTTFEEGVDYTVTGVQTGLYQWNYTTLEHMKDKYSEFQVTFLHDITASSSDPITISYNMKMDNKVYNEGERSGSWALTNYLEVAYMVNGVLTDAMENGNSGGAYYQWSDLPFNIPLTKNDGTYDAKTGTVSWTIDANRVSTVGGDATLIDLLPEGLTFESATITEMGCLASDNTHRTATTMNGKGINQAVTAEDCEVETVEEDGKTYTKVSLSLENLSAFEGVSGGKLVTDVHGSVNGSGHNGYAYGRVTIQITAKVDTEILASDEELTLTNKAILTDNDALPAGGVSATGDVTIPATGSSVVSKAMATKEAPAYLKFALNVNENALDLMAGEDSLAIDDVMGTGMSMATAHKDCFKVYKVSGTDQVSASEAEANGQEITGQCTWEDITTDTTKPTYRFTVPDATHVVIVYWATFSGAVGQSVSSTNTANFYYEGHDYSNNSSRWKDTVRVLSAGADAFTFPYFYLQKQDQWGNNVSGAVFNLYQYDRDTQKFTYVSSRTTEDGLAYIGHRTDITDSFANLSMNTIYKLEEYSSPVGYTIDEPDHYFEFVDLTGNDDNATVTDQMIKDHQATHPEGMNVIDIAPGGTYTVTNTFTGAYCQIPVAKTINGESISSTVDFTFTLKKDSNTAVYTDGNYKEAMPSDGLTATITGTGSTNFKTLYFKSAGTYLFTLTENALSKDASDRGYTKDTNTYKVVVVVSEKDKALAVTSVTYTSDSGDGDILEKGDVPTFDNKLSLTGSLDLEVKKTVTGRAKEVQEGEFSFEVVDNSTGETVKDSEGNAMVFKTESGGNVKIQIPITQEDIGTKRYIIREVVPADADKDPTISYTASPVIAKVTIGEVTAAENGGTAGVAATSKVTYTASKTDNGVPLMVNEYHATGSLKLEGTKELLYGTEKQAIKAGRFNFVVMEGNTQVATGTTNGDWEDNIDFTEINYVTADIGPHTYTISEVNDGEMFVEYTDKTFTVTVDVEDAGDGKLTASAKYDTEDGEKDYRQHALFVNTCTFIIPTGIRLDVLPYVLILILALGCGALVLRRRKHMRG